VTAGGILAAAVGAATLWYVVAPLLRKDAAESERISAAVSEERDLESRREMLVSALKDLEDDRATGKVDDADYDGLKTSLSSDAVEVMKQLDALDEARQKAHPVALPTPKGDAGEPEA
jgi:hypothetical protein